MCYFYGQLKIVTQTEKSIENERRTTELVTQLQTELARVNTELEQLSELLIVDCSICF